MSLNKKHILLLATLVTMSYYTSAWVRRTYGNIVHQKQVLMLMTRMGIDFNNPFLAAVQIRALQKMLPSEVDGSELDELLLYLGDYWQRSGISCSQPLPAGEQ